MRNRLRRAQRMIRLNPQKQSNQHLQHPQNRIKAKQVMRLLARHLKNSLGDAGKQSLVDLKAGLNHSTTIKKLSISDDQKYAYQLLRRH